MFHNLNATSIADIYVANKTDSHDLEWIVYDLYGDLLMNCPTYLFAKNYALNTGANKHSNVYFYEQTYRRAYGKDDPMARFGVTHGADIDFVFGLSFIKPLKTDTEIYVQFSRQVMKMWTDFAKYGKPNNDWPNLIDLNNPKRVSKVYNLNPNSTVDIFDNLFAKTCDGYWKDYY
ncbi:acylcarnitine hydrolase-like [Oppia nitens]|uniref:acylcarnitine hydrolase-like n=1 Tax=Oppia nitens TaxID=1686743 RepID=UPI0023DBB8C7|nr:acylcarnitine hydrolase-like [Oppia nitens]